MLQSIAEGLNGLAALIAAASPAGEEPSLGYRMGWAFAAFVRYLILASPLIVVAVVAIVVYRKRKQPKLPPKL